MQLNNVRIYLIIPVYSINTKFLRQKCLIVLQRSREAKAVKKNYNIDLGILNKRIS